MKALSIQQPWAWLIVHGLKDLENRDWPLPKAMIGQRIVVHAGKRYDQDALSDLLRRRLITVPQAEQAASATRGAIVGEVTITGCVTESDSPWFCGLYAFTLADPMYYEVPLLYKGQLSFFDVRVSEAQRIGAVRLRPGKEAK